MFFGDKEPDFAEDENIYDDLNLEEEEELWGIVNDEHHSSHDSITDGGILHFIFLLNYIKSIYASNVYYLF